MTTTTGTAPLQVLEQKHLWHIPPWQGNGAGDLTAFSTSNFWGFMDCQSHLSVISL